MNPHPPSRMTLGDCAAALGDNLVSARIPDPAVHVDEVVNHSGQVAPGTVFAAIAGRQADGHAFLAQAVAAGAAAVVYSQADRPPPPTVAAFRVRDAYAAYAALVECRFGYPTRGLTLVGVTGTNGKTSTVYLLHAILGEAGHTCGKITTVSQAWPGHAIPSSRTTPEAWEIQNLFAEMRDAGCSHVVMEVSSHALDQHRTGAATFAGALFTNLTGDHLDYHGDMESYFAAKRRLFAQHLAPDAATAIHLDDPYGRRLVAEFGGDHAFPFGADPACRCHIQAMRFDRLGTELTLVVDGHSLPLRSGLIGRHNALNLAGAAALAHGLGISHDLIRRALARPIAIPGRLEAFHTANGVSIFVDYAHTDDALAHVLQTLRALGAGGRILVVFGCGGDRDRSKRPRMGTVAAKLADRIILTSDNPRSENPLTILCDIQAGIPDGVEYRSVADRRAAIRAAVAEAQPGDLVLVAGKGHENHQEINGEKFPFDDREEVIAACRNAGLKLRRPRR
jgi:UDP-N-acetylmuramoyl-L-alanyl-D-glutamate--2,6-diaminopimelate ligase